MAHKNLAATTGLRFAVMLLAGGCAAGCNSFGPSQTVTPSFTGRVLAADTQLPLAGVTVSRVPTGQGVSPPAKGAQLLQRGRPEITGTDGVFEVPGQSYATLFRHASWWSVRLVFESPGYVSWQTNYSAGSFTNQIAAGATTIDVGNVLLPPRIR